MTPTEGAPPDRSEAEPQLVDRPWWKAIVSSPMAVLAQFAGARQRWVSLSHAFLVLALPFSLYRPLAQPSSPGVLDIYVTPGIFLTDFAILGVLLATSLLQKPWQHPFPGEKRISFLFLALIVAALLSIPWSLSPKVAGYTSLRWLIGLLLYLALLQDRFPIERTMTIFLAGLSLHALIGALQVLLQAPLGLPGELIPVWDSSRVASIRVGSQWFLRAYGLTFHPNVFGGLMAMGLILGLPLLRRGWTIPFWMILWMGLLLSFSRSAWLATGLVLPLVAGALIWQRREMRRRFMIAFSLAIVVLIGFGLLQFQQIRSRMSLISLPSERASWSARGELITTALHAISIRPWTGLGAGNFPLAASMASIQEIPHPVHNIPFLLASEVGVMGGIIWLCLWLFPAWALLSSRARRDPLTIALTAAWFALGIIALWDFYPWGLECGRLLSVTLLAWLSRTMAQPSPLTQGASPLNG